MIALSGLDTPAGASLCLPHETCCDFLTLLTFSFVVRLGVDCSIDGLSPVQIHTKYDLKGSTVHRTAKDGEKVLKDNNLRKANGTFRLGSQRDAFLEVPHHRFSSRTSHDSKQEIARNAKT